MQIRKDILVSVLSSIIVVLYGFVTTFLLPHFLTVKDYGLYRLFTLFIGYVGFFHFGMLDGIQLMFGGKNIEEISSTELNNAFFYFVGFEAFITILLVIYGLFIQNILVVFFGIAVFSINCYNFFIYLYQSIGKIREAALLNMFVYILLLSVNVVCLFLFKMTDYIIYVVNQFLVFFLVMLFIAVRSQKIYKLFSFKLFSFESGTFRKMITNGFVLMLANILYIGLLSFDKLFIRYEFTIETFSFYSFAFAILIIGNSVFMAVGNSIFFHFKKSIGGDEINLFLKVILSFISCGSAVIFFTEDLIDYFLPKYELSLPIIRIFLPAILPMAIIGLILLNVFKTEQKLWLLVKLLLAVNGLSVILYFLAAHLYKSEVIVAYIFEFITYLFLLFCLLTVKVKFQKPFGFFVLAYLLIYFISISVQSNMVGLFLYGSLILVLNAVLWTLKAGSFALKKSI